MSEVWLIVHPSPFYDMIKPMSWRWHWEQYLHEIRWERRYNKPYPHIKGELGWM